MKRSWVAVWIVASMAVAARSSAQSTDPFQFFDSEANVVSASLSPQPLRRAPASVYVITAEEIQASGTQTLWDVLRSVPGVDVMTTRASQGEVSIRGLNKPLNNRTLVLLDGRSVLNGYFDFVTWEGIPVTLEEIDRIEIVEGPVSALYGANAVNGVINIITKTAEQIDGGIVSFTSGEQSARLGTVLVGRRSERLSVKSGISMRNVHPFDGAVAGPSSEVSKLSAHARYELSPRLAFSASGGLVNLDTEVSAGVIGTAKEFGPRGFLSADLDAGGTHARVFWNRGRTAARDLNALGSPNLYFDTYDITIEHAVANTARHALTVGAGARRNTMVSDIFAPGTHAQSLWALFGEERWSLHPKVDFLASARLDHHELAGAMLSPRGSVVYAPQAHQAFRVSVGSAFRNPTLTENYVRFTQVYPNAGGPIPNPPYEEVAFTVLGNRDLDPERLLHFEVGHSGTFGKLQTTVALFRSRLSDLISTAATQEAGNPPVFTNIQTFVNRGAIATWGGEVGAVWQVAPTLSAVGNFSRQKLTEQDGEQGSAVGSPGSKANVGVRYHASSVVANAMVHHVSSTRWARYLGAAYPDGFGVVDAYTTLDLSLAYRMKGSLSGLRLGLSAFNATNHRHYEILPSSGPLAPGQNGELVGRRVTANVSYSFK